MGVYHPRQVGLKGRVHGLRDRVHSRTSLPTSPPSNANATRPRAGSSIEARDTDSSKKESHCPPSLPARRRGHIFFLSDAKEKRRLEANTQSETVKSVYRTSTLQDGYTRLDHTILGNRSLGDVHRFIGRLSAHPDSRGPLSVPNICVRRDHLSVSGAPIRVIDRPTGFHPLNESSSDVSTPQRHLDFHVSRRLVDSRKGQGNCVSAHPTGSEPRQETRLGGEPREIRPPPYSTSRLLGSGHRFGVGSDSSHSGAISGTSSRGRCPADEPRSDSQGLAGISGVSGQHGRYCSMVPAADATASMAPIVSLSSQFKGLNNSSSLSPRRYSGDTMVDSTVERVMRQTHSPPRHTIDFGDGCLSFGLGRSSGRSSDGRDMDGTLATLPHQCFGTRSDCQSAEIFSPPSSGEGHIDQVRQHHGGSLHQPSRRNPLENDVEFSREAVPLVHATRDSPSGPASPGQREHDSGHVVSSHGGSDGMVVEAGGVSENLAGVRTSRSGFVCVSSESQTPVVLRSSTGRRSVEGGRDVFSLGSGTDVRIPTVCSTSSGSGQSCQGRSFSDSYRSSVAVSTVVPSSIDSSVRLSTSSSGNSGSINHATVGTVSSKTTVALSDCLEDLRNSFTEKGLSTAAAAMAANSRRQSTLRLYATRFGLFRKWCQDRQVSPLSAPLGEVADFLLSMFSDGKQVNTIKGFRSAIAAFHSGFSDGSTVSSNDMLSSLIQGMFHTRPTVRKLAPPWDMTKVLESLLHEPYEPLDKASLKHVTLKTVFLVTAASLRRRSAIHVLSIARGHMRFENGGVRLVPDPAFLAGNQTLEFLPEPIFIPKISTVSSVREDSLWCPVRALRFYLKRTQYLRGDTTSLFVSFNRPHKATSRETISRWIVLVITSCKEALMGERVSAHQVRAVASSIALFSGVPVAEILAAAVWKTPTTFVSTYLRDVSQNYGACGRAVLAPQLTGLETTPTMNQPTQPGCPSTSH